MNVIPLSLAVIVPTRALWDQAHACLQNLPVRISVEAKDLEEPDSLLDRIERHNVDVVLVEARHSPLPLDEFTRRLQSMPGQPAVFVLHNEPSPEMILEALRAGANEFLFPPLTETLRDAFVRFSAQRSRGPAGPARLGKVFGFLSGRGGAGATTIAMHVAASLAQQLNSQTSQPGAQKQPLLVADCDFEAGVLRFLMKSKSTYSVRDALDNLHRMDSSYWKALITSHVGHLDFIGSPDDIAAKRGGTKEQMTHLLRFIRSLYPASVVDFGRHLSVTALNSLAELETLYLVVPPDRQGLEQSRRAIQMIEAHGMGTGAQSPEALRILLNSAPQKNPRECLAEAAEVLGRDVTDTLPNDFKALYDAYSEGQLVAAGSVLGKGFQALSASLCARVMAGQEGAGDGTQGPSGRIRSGEGKAGALGKLFSFFQRAPRQPASKAQPQPVGG